jgi:hypothetical protein
LTATRHSAQLTTIQVFRRPVRPFHLALTLACVNIAWLNLSLDSTPLSETRQGDLVGLAALVGAGLLAYG